MKREFRITADGSHSIYLPEMDEQYHSHHGSIVEAKKVYIEYGLMEAAKGNGQIRLFEMGFGSGLNAFLTLNIAAQQALKIDYYGLEKYPLSADEVAQLNFPQQLQADIEDFMKLHDSAWEDWVEISSTFRLKKSKQDLREVRLEGKLDLIYFDAFAPEKQPQLWTEEIFQKLFDALTDGGILTTYCVKGEVRRILQKLGFTIEKLPGPEGGKREVLRAIK